MSDHIYKIIEITGTSDKGSDEAVRNAIARASKSVRHMRWFEVLESRGTIKKDEVESWQVTLKIGFSLED
ncbi:MAG: Dodecin Flavin-binding protein [Gammaproteobacteria bacterium]|nr:MAG: Dodecin Flavin-binding protein [Gammaproteobacteria bacterium]TND03951.1 MAG: Dodecin, Flavin-binding protein [Gammaproteobacteria bacterium]